VQHLVGGDNGPFDGISCPTTSTCLAITGDSSLAPELARTTNGGASWTFTPLGISSTPLQGIACTSTTSCVVVGTQANVFVITDGGSSWARASVPFGVTGLDAVACATSSDCVAVGANAFGVDPFPIATSTDGGLTWQGVFPA